MNKDNGSDDNSVDDEVETSEMLDPFLPRLDLTSIGIHTNLLDL